MKPTKIWKGRQQSLDKMSIIKSTDRTPKLDKLNPFQLTNLDKLNPIQLINLDKLNPIQLIRILHLSQSLITLRMRKMGKNLLLKMSENRNLNAFVQMSLAALSSQSIIMNLGVELLRMQIFAVLQDAELVLQFADQAVRVAVLLAKQTDCRVVLRSVDWQSDDDFLRFAGQHSL
uniref:Uncharacterized protein n=1 Tax=Globodera rostochiensis TaxID=31243 RepID=A0A914H9L5_GLORO